MRRSFILALAAAGGLAAGPLVWTSPAFPQTNDDCQTCHADAELKAESGKSLFVDVEKFSGSSHGQAGISCVDCHADLAKVADYPSRLAAPARGLRRLP